MNYLLAIGPKLVYMDHPWWPLWLLLQIAGIPAMLYVMIKLMLWSDQKNVERFYRDIEAKEKKAP